MGTATGENFNGGTSGGDPQGTLKQSPEHEDFVSRNQRTKKPSVGDQGTGRLLAEDKKTWLSLGGSKKLCWNLRVARNWAADKEPGDGTASSEEPGDGTADREEPGG